jgi:ribosomal protein S18 acetylase RimI-like enzyme
MIQYFSSIENITPEQLGGFFVGWPNPPQPETHLRLLQNAYKVSIARHDASGQVVGFAYAISDKVLSAFIPLVEVLPAYQGQGIGTELVKRLLNQLEHLYAIDLMCDPELQPFYARLDMRSGTGMMYRNFDYQDGANDTDA